MQSRTIAPTKPTKREIDSKKMEECCALCEKRAMMQCDSDQAKLCWDCDEKVHSANFLVAKHSRILLCRLCHSLTPWKASGTKLTPTVSFCHRCVADRHNRFTQLDRNEQLHPNYVDEDGEYGHARHHHDDDNDDDEGEDDDEEGENQVVPMSSASASSPPSASDLALKRLRNNSFSVDSHEETGCSSSEMHSGAMPSSDESTSMSVFGSLKKHRNDERNY
ncbi:zinc finger protein CONSTANS-LIKE 4-like [Abrus precatorius]|uniref:Zinc finger protein CONSTANS-LIKE 4-like n=1 Tax=Abrus precatorius TaxID=3816 RepID=A0A8B8LNR5_ABRPR|nr:zinc finger protein CONSTANS-LIKE 4-like [Abrus precatorius]